MFKSLLRTAAVLAALWVPASFAAEDITFAWTPNPQTPQVDIALAKGYFEEAGLNVSLVSFPTGREGFEALLGGQVDITFMAEFPAVTGALRDQAFGIIGDLARYTGSRIIGSAKAGEFATPADLAGLRIGTTLGTNVNYFLSEVLRNAGVEAEIVNASPVDLVSAVTRGDVDAIVPFPTFYSAAKSALGEDYRELRAPGYQPHFVLAASPAMINDRADVLQAFLGALLKGDADVKADPDAAMDEVVESLNGAMPKDALATMWQDVDVGLQLKSDLLDLLVAEAKWILEQGVINGEAPSAADLRAYFADAALRAVAPEVVDLP